MRPEGTSRAEALDIRIKIAVSGVFVIGGVLLEESLSKTFIALFIFLPGGLLTTLVAVLTGYFTGLGTV